MDEIIIEHFEMKLLQNPQRVRQLDGSIKEIYIQPERSKREDFFGMEASVSEGILTMDNGMKFDLNQPIEDAVL